MSFPEASSFKNHEAQSNQNVVDVIFFDEVHPVSWNGRWTLSGLSVGESQTQSSLRMLFGHHSWPCASWLCCTCRAHQRGTRLSLNDSSRCRSGFLQQLCVQCPPVKPWAGRGSTQARGIGRRIAECPYHGNNMEIVLSNAQLKSQTVALFVLFFWVALSHLSQRCVFHKWQSTAGYK